MNDIAALEFLGKTLLPKRWIFAKTMLRNPHWYTLRKEWKDDAVFDKTVDTMRRVGYTERYKGKPYTMINLNGYRYWTMGAPIPTTILINRKVISPVACYDSIATNYDMLHIDDGSLKENRDIIDMISWGGESVLDVGCGTGLFLDYIQPDVYLGIDPSAEMLAILTSKHPNAKIMQTSFEEYWSNRPDLLVSLFGAASYISPEHICRMSKLGKRWFVMFFKDDYYPKTYKKTGIDFKHYKGNHKLLDGELIEFGNFWVVSGQ